jgi:hypothetical protein
MCYDCLTQIQPWKSLEIYKNLSLTLKQDNPMPPYLFKIANSTSNYEKKLRELWAEFKKNPTTSNAKKLADYMKEYSREIWRDSLLDILGISELSDKEQEILNEQLDIHNGFIQNSLLPDLIKEIGKGREMFDNFDYRVIFLYAGALWSFGFLATIMFNGLELRDLSDIFIFTGPNDAMTCRGRKGCSQHVGKPYTVAEILGRDLIPGRFYCKTSCRHILIPFMSLPENAS